VNDDVRWHDEGGITFPAGFVAAGVAAGIKSEGRDLAILASETACAAAGVFTTNKVAAEPVKLSRERIRSGRARAVVVNSGNANACTGPQGRAHALQMTEAAADRLGLEAVDVLVCSTGTIGKALPIDRVLAGIDAAAAALSPNGGAHAAEAILTTDTRPKAAACEVALLHGTVNIGGMAKGAGMIRPDMATMLAFVTTDARVETGLLDRALRRAVDRSFHRITVDDDQSTNDTVLVLANGASGISVSAAEDAAVFEDALGALCRRLALEIVRDGEGATKLVRVEVNGALSDEDAERTARAVAGSMLVKSSWFGNDPNWGRIMHAIGYAGVDIDETRVNIDFADVPVVRGGVGTPEANTAAAVNAVSGREFGVRIDLGIGQGRGEIFSSDLSYEYVRINAEH
jgi:glutamate N-acetyltransferase/amino-acid N-acetyltransferase